MPFGGDRPFDDIDEMLDRLQSEIERATRGIEGSSTPGGPAVDVAEHEDEYVVTADLPGFDREEIDVSLVDRSLRIEADHQTTSETDEETETGTYIRKERRREATSRTVRLPGPVDEEAVSATYSNGVLTVTLPKTSTDAGHRIEIE